MCAYSVADRVGFTSPVKNLVKIRNRTYNYNEGKAGVDVELLIKKHPIPSTQAPMHHAPGDKGGDTLDF